MQRDSDSVIHRIHPYVVYGGHLNEANCPPEGSAFRSRTTKWYELELIVWGRGYIDTCGKRAETTRGRLFFRRPGMRVQGFAPYFSYLILFDMIFDPGKRELYDSYGAEQLYGEESSELEGGTLFPFPSILDVRDCETWEKRFGSLYREFIDSGGSNQFYLKTGVLQLLLHLKEEAASAAGCPASVHYPAIMAVKSHIDREPSARFCLAELAKRAGMSRSFFCSQFTKIVGISPIAYGNLARIRLAKRLLLQTHLSATEISYECGFETTTYFFRVFKKIVGVTPAQYRDRTNHNYNWFWCKN